MVKLKMKDGRELELSMTMRGLRKARSDYPQFTAAYFDAIGGKTTDSLEEAFWRGVDILYAAYLCGVVVKEDEIPMSYDDFLDNLPDDVSLITLTASAIINPRQTTALEKYLSDTPTASG